ncbi:MAG: tyrosine--tRNA ligase [Phycisphaerales bacterium]|nr:MAG: tyrosine--tRNA ligase [Phycisphaerales bacterium]
MTPTSHEILFRGADSIYSAEELTERLRLGRPLRVKLGMDPTAPDLTLGHTVVLRKLRQFQDAGHKAVLIIGDYTAMIGDPTGRSKTRPVLSADDIETNARTYFDQAGMVLDLSPDKVEVRHNSEWLSKLSFADVVKLMSRMTTARMLERDTFARRQAEGKEIYLHELLYPLMQAYDSVMIQSDVELGGTDQTFNNLCGRDLQRSAGQLPQIVLVMPILIGTDGAQKMSKSLGNYVAVTDPPGEMFGKVMSIPDALMANWFTLLTDLPAERIAKLTDASRTHPRQAKETLARTIVTQYHGAAEAEAAAQEFSRVFGGGGGGLPDDVPEIDVSSCVENGTASPVDLIVACGFAQSRSEARRLVSEKGVRLNGETIDDAVTPVAVKPGDVIQRGKRKFAKLVL